MVIDIVYVPGVGCGSVESTWLNICGVVIRAGAESWVMGARVRGH